MSENRNSRRRFLLGTTERDYAESCRGATLGEGLAVRGEEVAGAQPAVEDSYGVIGLLTR